MHVYDTNGEPRYFGRYAATVTDNADPRSLGRVRFRIEGLIDSPGSGWAFPVGGARSSGSAQRGGFDVPEIGATVLASFLAGDVDQPIYEGAWPGAGEAPTGVPAPADASKVQIFESPQFLLTLDSRSGSPAASLVDKASGEKIVLTPGAIQIEGPNVTVGAANAAQAMFLAETYRQAEATMNAQLSAAATTLGAASTGPLAALAPGFSALLAAWQSFEALAATFLSASVKNS